MDTVLKTDTARVESADVGKHTLAKLSVEHTATVVHSHGAVSVVARLKPSVCLGSGMIRNPKTAIETAAKLGATLYAQKMKVVLH